MKTLGLVDIIGPIMVGPSSSHTAGALRIARMARNLLGETPVRVLFSLYGSFAHTKSGHGTDKALVAGILGLNADDLAIRDSFDLAHANNLEVDFFLDPQETVDHPNTVDIHLEGREGTILEVRGVSIGGGAAAIRRIDNIDVDITGEHTSIVVRQHDVSGVLAHIAGCLSGLSLNIGTARMYRTRRGSGAYTVMEVDGMVPAEIKAAIEQHPGVLDARIVPPDNPDTSTTNAPAACTDTPTSPDAPLPNTTAPHALRSNKALDEIRALEAAEEHLSACDFTSGADLLTLCEQNNCSLAEAFRMREQALANLDEQLFDIDDYLDRALSVMRTSATEPLINPALSMGGLIGGEAHDVYVSRQHRITVVDSLIGSATEYALAVLETNASMGRIVAAPTAGSAGVLPGVLFALEQERSLDIPTLRKGLLSAAAVGYLIARNATVSGAEGGCQAEIGSAAAMAAAAAVEMVGGSAQQALNAAANALISLMGLVCDPIGGLVEIPCQKRNATAAATALVSAQIALAGIANLVNFDETVEAMDAVGRSLPFELRESALGGIAATPSACSWCAKSR